MLRKPLSWAQWFSLVLLFVGVSLVQLQGGQSPPPSPRIPLTNLNTSDFSLTTAATTSGFLTTSEKHENNQFMGLTA
uniref:Uncharacterized protein n=1 Tax=Romanomermis culicivorax TaxID=13658 RepID=A0A915KI31_ROMCU